MRKIPSPQWWKSVGAAIGLLKLNTKARKLSTIRKDGTHISATIEMKTIGFGSIRITMRKGVLMADGVTPLEEGKDGLFRMRSEEADREWIQFHDIVNGHAMRIKLSGEDLWRVLAP